MNQVATIGPFEAFRAQVLPPERASGLFASLPAHVKPERFERNLAIALRQHPNLLKCDPEAVFNEVSKAAALGLLLDPQLGEAYLITGWNNQERRLAPQLRVGYRGLIKLGRQSGEIAASYAHEVCERDEFECVLGDNKRLHHKPNLAQDRGEAYAYYAVVKLAGGETDFEVMSIREVHRIRDRSDGWKAFQEKKIKSTPWATDEGEMAKKTVIRRLMKRMPASPELADALRIEDEADYRDFRDVTPERPTLASRLKAGTTAPGFSLEHVERETAGEQRDEEQGGEEQVLDTPTETSPVSPGEQEDRPGASAPQPQPGLSSAQFTAYHQALARAVQPASLKGLHEAFVGKAVGAPPDEDTAILREIYALHVRRLKGEISAEDVTLQVRELAGA
ncbi:recombinase RecT [Xanthobacter flavus]|uniref:recombinase RecT n=1 Tax=Xanthobacter flavus TaxID=281 RepID=UPI001AE18B07|nr:recombination protein RecT [Xanthobacter flavus]